MIAAAEGSVEIINLLLDTLRSIGDANGVGDQDSVGNTALHYASWQGHLDCCKLLIEHKANPLLKNKDGMPPVHFAAAGNHILVVEYLMSLESAATDPEVISPGGLNNLHRACMHGSLETVRALVEKHRADISSKSGQNGNTPLHFAAHGGYIEIVKFLIECGAAVNDCNDYGLTPLHLACIRLDKCAHTHTN
jgi:ankyrin repeat protein